MKLLNGIEKNINTLLTSVGEIPEERKILLLKLSQHIVQKLRDEGKINLTFICTHNSRRSLMSQIWAQTAAEYFNIPDVRCYSGGTEATAFYSTAVITLKESGFEVKKSDETDNPTYLVYYSEVKEPLKCFSKVYNDSFNPQENFTAIMTCSQADKNCPLIIGAEARFPLTYEDPKKFDGTESERIKYKERFNQIGREMLFLFSNIKEELNKI